MEISRLTRDGTTEPVSRDQILGRERGQENVHFPCSADHEQDCQPYPIDPYSCSMCDHTYMVEDEGYDFCLISLLSWLRRALTILPAAPRAS